MSSYEENNYKDYFRPRRSKAENKKACAPEGMQCSTLIDQIMLAKGYSEIQKKINILYDHWDMTLGEELAQIAFPIGHRGKILLIAGEDSISMNELTYAKDDILERVHTFLEEEYFEKIELHLLHDKTPLNKLEFTKDMPKIELIRPENLGNLNLPEGKVKEAYLHYLTLFENTNA